METKIDVYVQSRGLTQDHDYRWLKIETNGQTPEIPTILKGSIQADGKRMVPVELIDSQKFSIVLFRLANELTLLITGLKAGEERIDFAGRSIRNSLLIRGRYGYEKDFRGILIRALTEQLELDLDRVITSGGDYGFTVDKKAIRTLAKLEDLQFDTQANHIDRIAKNTPENRKDLALELRQNQLPNREGLLVVVTSLKAGSVLETMGVWRGLSNRIESEIWQDYNKRILPSSTVSRQSILPVTHNQTQAKKGGLILLIVLLLIILVAILAQILQPRSIPQPEIQFRQETLSPEAQITPHEIEIQPETAPTYTPETQPETWKIQTPTSNKIETTPTPQIPPETLPTNDENSREKLEN